jgi:hypothetical protein
MSSWATTVTSDARASWSSRGAWGAATPAEIAALEAFAEDESVRSVHASSVEEYGPCEPPAGAAVYFHGEDPTVGQLTKYTVVRCVPSH